MKTILQILRQAGGWHHGLYLTIENPPHVSLVIDAMDESGPCGLPALSVAQYANGLAVPEMYFEWSQPFWFRPRLVPFYWRNDQLGVEQMSRSCDGTHYVFDPELNGVHEKLAALWDKMLDAQGFAQAYERSRIQR